jgi:nucleoid DNA-binding protein
MGEADMDEDESGAGGAGRKGKGKRRVAKTEINVVSGKAPRSGVQVKKKDFLDQVTAASGANKAEVRGVLDAALTLMAERLKAGDEIALPPLGKLRMVREKDNGKVRIATLRLQLAGDGESGTDPLAEAGD